MAGRHTSDGEYDSYQLSSGSLINAPPSINAPPDKGGLDKSVLSSIFSFLHLSGAGGASGKKTVPFARTGAAVQSEFNNILKASSQGQLQNQLTRMSDETKLRLIIESQKKFDSDLSLLKKGHLYYDKIFDILMNGGKPPVKSLAGKYKTSERISHARYQYAPEPGSEDERVFSEDYLSQFLELKPDELKQMTIAHKYVVDHLNNLPTPDGLYKGDGIVFVGGGKFNWLTLLSIKSIRSVGSELPIEVLIPKLDEFEPDLCARVFPALNARCIYLPHVLSGTASTINKIQFDGYQYKALAILLSSFENVLLLDSDNIPVHPPDHLFKSEPFPLKGLIVWPDFWRRATSPDYFRLAGMNIDPKVLTPKYNEITGEYETELKPTTAKEMISRYIKDLVLFQIRPLNLDN